jgi:hypothetical protein
MDLFVPLTQKDSDALDAVTASLKPADHNLSRELWVVGKLRDVASKNARVFYSLDMKGPMDIGNGKQMAAEDLRDFPAKESHGDGSSPGVVLRISSSLVKGLEDSASVVEAVNRLNGLDTAWFTFDEWLRRYVSEAIFDARVELAQNEISAP